MRLALPHHPAITLLCYAMLAFAALWLGWTALALGDLHRAHLAQGFTHAYYPTAEILIGIALLVAGLIAIRLRFWPAAIVAAEMLVIASQLYWIGSTS